MFKNRGFSRASLELHLAQPTISEHIKTLERELNCKLFERLGKKIIPTREADVLYNLALSARSQAAMAISQRTHRARLVRRE